MDSILNRLDGLTAQLERHHLGTFDLVQADRSQVLADVAILKTTLHAGKTREDVEAERERQTRALDAISEDSIDDAMAIESLLPGNTDSHLTSAVESFISPSKAAGFSRWQAPVSLPRVDLGPLFDGVASTSAAPHLGAGHGLPPTQPSLLSEILKEGSEPMQVDRTQLRNLIASLMTAADPSGSGAPYSGVEASVYSHEFTRAVAPLSESRAVPHGHPVPPSVTAAPQAGTTSLGQAGLVIGEAIGGEAGYSNLMLQPTFMAAAPQAEHSALVEPNLMAAAPQIGPNALLHPTFMATAPQAQAGRSALEQPSLAAARGPLSSVTAHAARLAAVTMPPPPTQPAIWSLGQPAAPSSAYGHNYTNLGPANPHGLANIHVASVEQAVAEAWAQQQQQVAAGAGGSGVVQRGLPLWSNWHSVEQVIMFAFSLHRLSKSTLRYLLFVITLNRR